MVKGIYRYYLHYKCMEELNAGKNNEWAQTKRDMSFGP